MGLREQGENRFSRPGKATDNAHVESFNGRLREECLNSHWFVSMQDAKRVSSSPGARTTMRAGLTGR